MTQYCATHKAHPNGRGGGDGADVQSMQPCDRLLAHHIAAVLVVLQFSVARVGTQAVPAVFKKAQTPLPVLIPELRVTGGAANRLEGALRLKAWATGQSGEVLKQHIKRCLRWSSLLHQAVL